VSICYRFKQASYSLIFGFFSPNASILDWMQLTTVILSVGGETETAIRLKQPGPPELKFPSNPERKGPSPAAPIRRQEMHTERSAHLDGVVVAVVREAEGAERAVHAVEAVHVALALVRVRVDPALDEEARGQQRL
jgi:hypothetical protein